MGSSMSTKAALCFGSKFLILDLLSRCVCNLTEAANAAASSGGDWMPSCGANGRSSGGDEMPSCGADGRSSGGDGMPSCGANGRSSGGDEMPSCGADERSSGRDGMPSCGADDRSSGAAVMPSCGADAASSGAAVMPSCGADAASSGGAVMPSCGADGPLACNFFFFSNFLFFSARLANLTSCAFPTAKLPKFACASWLFGDRVSGLDAGLADVSEIGQRVRTIVGVRPHRPLPSSNAALSCVGKVAKFFALQPCPCGLAVFKDVTAFSKAACFRRWGRSIIHRGRSIFQWR